MIFSHSLIFDLDSMSPFTMKNHAFADKLVNFSFNVKTKKIVTTVVAIASIEDDLKQYKGVFPDLKIFAFYYDDCQFIIGNVPYKDDTLLVKLINRLELLLILEERGKIYFKVKEDFITPYQITSINY